jgi:dihydrofolate synthase / folylpolyglutamate synthase
MHFFAIKTHPLIPPQDDIYVLIDKYLVDIQDWDILFITSKIVAIHQGRCYRVGNVDKTDLIRQESNYMIETDIVPGRSIYLTIRDNLLIPSAGIDESNADGHYILLPDHLEEFSSELHTYLIEKHKINHLGIVITDSTTHPLRNGVVWVTLYAYGFDPIRDERGKLDIFGKPLAITQINIVDALAGSAVYLMGEWAECQPFAIGRDIPNIRYTLDSRFDSITIEPHRDLYRDLLQPLLQHPWSRS